MMCKTAVFVGPDKFMLNEEVEKPYKTTKIQEFMCKKHQRWEYFTVTTKVNCSCIATWN